MTDTPEHFANTIADKIAGAGDPEVCCPKCGEPLPFSMVTKFKDQSRVIWCLVPAPGELFSGTTIGASIEALSSLMQSVGEDIGIPTEVLVERCSTDERGAVEVVFLITRLEAATMRRGRFAKRNREGVAAI